MIDQIPTVNRATAADPSIRRILIALDATAESFAALDAAADLAECLQAELLGLFVEDINLVNLAALPIAREIDLAGGGIGKIDRHTVERQFRMQQQKAQSALAKAAESRRVTWSFRVTRGQVAAELLKAAPDVDLVTLGKGGFPLTRRSRLGSTALTVAGESHHTYIVSGGGVIRKSSAPISVAYDGSACAKKALGIAVGISGARGAVLKVFLMADADSDGDRLKGEVAEILEHQGAAKLPVTYTRLDASDEACLIRAIAAEAGGLLVAGGVCLALTQQPLRRLLEATTQPVLLVKGS
ncbi:MAG: universal stress protein [Rhodospirillales bacterium]|nr:universal stress protein [Rhodospirillales bacterium]